MNKKLKFMVAVLGAIDVVFSLFSPIAIALLVIIVFTLSPLNNIIILSLGLLSSFYRAIKFFIKKNE